MARVCVCGILVMTPCQDAHESLLLALQRRAGTRSLFGTDASRSEGQIVEVLVLVARSSPRAGWLPWSTFGRRARRWRTWPAGFVLARRQVDDVVGPDVVRGP